MLFILLQAASSIISMLPLFAIFIVMYFFMIRPQVKRQKEQASFVSDLSGGMEVVTMSGIIGKISKIEGDVVTLKLDDRTSIRVVKSAISKDMTQAYAKGDAVVPATN